MSKRINSKTAKDLRKIAKLYSTEKGFVKEAYIQNGNETKLGLHYGRIFLKPESEKFVYRTLKKRFKSGQYNPKTDTIS